MENIFTCKGNSMGVFFLIALIVPLAIYYIFIVLPLKMGVIDQIENKKKRAIYFWLLMLFPVGDHIVGYVVYKALCFSVGGVHIYKTVTDEAEQRAYWLNQYAPYVTSAKYGSAYGLREIELFTNDFGGKITAYLNYCKNEKECEEAKKYIQKGWHKIYTNKTYSSKIPRSTTNSNYIENSSIKIIWVATVNNIEDAYLNYCDSQYDTLPKEHENYKKSCTNADELIAQYHLENVIKVPKSLYSMSGSKIILLPFLVSIDSIGVINTKTKEKLGTDRVIVFDGGWYLQVVASFFASGRGGMFKSGQHEDIEKQIIPNPYKQSNQ